MRKSVTFYEKVRNFLKTVKLGLLTALLRYVFSCVYKFLKKIDAFMNFRKPLTQNDSTETSCLNF